MMSPMNIARGNALILQKRRLEERLKLCEKQIEDAIHNRPVTNIKHDQSSDSDSDLSIGLDTGPSVFNLKMLHSTLETCLYATKELTGLLVLESEVNFLVDDPDLGRQPPVTEPGTWKEITVECRVDLIAFSMSFYVHEPRRSFGSLSYRSLQVSACKPIHEMELKKSILVDVTKPSDAFEVMKSYAAANRSRRTTLARLAESYGDNLFMTPMADGGYKLRCANLLEISWLLQNRTSSVAPFKHQMNFDLEYKDESLLKTITQANKQLCNPSIATEERTSLLSAIIAECLEARARLPQSSADDNSETARPQKRTNANETEAPDAKRKKDAEVMAPPRVPPKKFKPKPTDNNADNQRKRNTNANDKQAPSVNKQLEANTASVSIKDKMDDRPKEKEAAAKTGNNDKGKKIAPEASNNKKINDTKKKPAGKSVANAENATNKTPNEEIKSQENISAPNDKVNKVDGTKNKNKPTQNFAKSKPNNVDGDTNNKNSAKLINVRGLNNSRLVKQGKGKAANANLQKTKIPQSVNRELIKKQKNPLRISPRKAANNSTTSQNSTQSTNSNANKPKENVPRLLKKPSPRKMVNKK